MKKIIIILISQLLIINVYGLENKKATLKKCTDGDTATLIVDNKETKVRFLAINTPEKNEYLGKEETDFTCNKLTNASSIELEFDKGSTEKDKYGRLLAWVYTDNKLLQEELITNGLAEVKYIYGKYKYTDNLYKLEETAKQNKLGIWKDKQDPTYTITFINDNTKFDIKVLSNNTIEEITPTKEGYKFLGWYNDNKKFDFNTKINDNLTLTAKYEKIYNTYEIIIVIIILIIIYLISPKKFKKIIKQIKKG